MDVGLIAWSDKLTKRIAKNMSIWDFGALKIALFIFGLIVGAYASSFVRQYVFYFAIVFVVIYAYLIYIVFGKSKKVGKLQKE
jgi:uncharacterized membrane protein YoaK (UPF0700 family)